MKINAFADAGKTNPNKTNFRKAKMKVNLFATKDYENEPAFKLRKNKPNQSQFLPYLF